MTFLSRIARRVLGAEPVLHPAIDRWHIARAPETAGAGTADLGFEELSATETVNYRDRVDPMPGLLVQTTPSVVENRSPTPLAKARLANDIEPPHDVVQPLRDERETTETPMPASPRVLEKNQPAAREDSATRGASPSEVRVRNERFASESKRLEYSGLEHSLAAKNRSDVETGSHTPVPSRQTTFESPESPSQRRDIRLLPLQARVPQPRLHPTGFEPAPIEPVERQAAAPVYIHIGRIDVKAVDPPRPAKAQAAPATLPKPSLEAHLRARDRGAR